MKIAQKRSFLILASLFGAAWISTGAPINQDAKALAKVLPKANLKGGDASRASGEIQKTLSAMSKTGRNTRSALDSLMSKAFDFREDIGAVERAVTQKAILDVWEEANAHGALDGKNQFTGRATQGRYSGQRLIFENIIPAEMAPEFVGYVGNIRVVPEELARKDGTPLSIRDRSFIAALRGVKKEHDSTVKMMALRNKKPLTLPTKETNEVGLEMHEAEARYGAEVEAAGDRVNQPPVIRLRGQRLSTPSNLNGGRYQVLFEATNLSHHPTEVSVELTIVGQTEEEGRNPIYQMAKAQETWRLRRSEVKRKELWAQAAPNTYKGYTIVAKFKGQVVAAAGSDGVLQQVAADGNSIPEK